MLRKIIMLIAVLALSACTTAYGPNGLTGGYKERKLTENSYIVSFFGNGHTSGQMVWNYWIYRCAELTALKGYTYFELETSEEHAAVFDFDGQTPVEFEMLPFGDESPSSVVPAYFYYTSYTTYSSKAIVNMYNDPVPESAGMLINANTILETLKPYVVSKGKAEAEPQQDIMIRAAVEAAIRSKRIKEEEADQFREFLKYQL